MNYTGSIFFLPSNISLRISLIFQGRRFSNSSGILLNKNVDATNTTLEEASGTLTKLTLKIKLLTQYGPVQSD